MSEADSLQLGIIILGAGSSSRMGQSKQLLDIGGEPLLRRTAKVALDSKPNNLIVVLGSNSEEHQKVVSDLPVKIVRNEKWPRGMGSSIKAGLSDLLQLNTKTGAIIILVCDQPLLNAEHIDRLMENFKESKAPIVASMYANTFGVPALFTKSLFQDILSLDDDQGAKKIIQENLSQAILVPFPEGEIDLDTPEDYSAFKKQ